MDAQARKHQSSMSTLATIICLPDLLRGSKAFPHGFFDLMREPIRQASGLDIGHAPDSGLPCNLLPGFSVEEFQRRAEHDTSQSSWEACFHAIPQAASDYLRRHIPPDALILSFEMPPWLATLCIMHDIAFIDIRPSPLRFGRDLYIALRTNVASYHERIAAQQVLAEELYLEANELAASVRMHQQRLEDAGRYHFNLDGCLVYIGQAPYDASLLSADKPTPLNCLDFADTLSRLAQGRRILHKPHPFAQDFAATERGWLQQILGTAVNTCMQNAYQILSCHHNVALVGISSGMLQEAHWFGKTAHTLHQPFTPLGGGRQCSRTGHIPCRTLSASTFRHLAFPRFLAPAALPRTTRPTHHTPSPTPAPPRPPPDRPVVGLRQGDDLGKIPGDRKFRAFGRYRA